jgi:hypothetical protein
MVADSIDPRRAQPRTRYSARADRPVGKRARVARRPARPTASIGLLPPGSCLSGGRSWWAHFEFTRINIEPIILKNKFEDLMNVSGVGEKSFLKMKPLITVTPAATAPAKQAASAGQ